MINRARGEVDVDIGGKAHRLMFTLDAFARVSAVLGVEAMEALEQRLREFRPADMLPVMQAICAGNGLDVSPDELRRMHPVDYVTALTTMWSRPSVDEEAPAAKASGRPRNRAA